MRAVEQTLPPIFDPTPAPYNLMFADRARQQIAALPPALRRRVANALAHLADRASFAGPLWGTGPDLELVTDRDGVTVRYDVDDFRRVVAVLGIER